MKKLEKIGEKLIKHYFPTFSLEIPKNVKRLPLQKSQMEMWIELKSKCKLFLLLNNSFIVFELYVM